MAARRENRRRVGKQRQPARTDASLVRCAPLEPIRVVERELTRPDGTKLRVEVPVYPPFRLPDRPASTAKSRKPSAKKKAS